MAFNFATLATGGLYQPGNKKKSGGGRSSFQPYSGLRPPRIDYTRANGDKVEYLRPTQDLTQKTIMDRSQGIGVGYDPERRQLLTDLVKSQLGAQEEDQLRSAKGSLASSGLSGNPRAYEALAGRVKRDSGRALGDSLSKIAIEDLTRANEERDVNTGRLQALNASNFGQENKAADFDLAVYGAENADRNAVAGLDQNAYQFDKLSRDQNLAELGQFGFDAASLFMGNPAPIISQVAGGKGIAPNYAGLSTPSFYNQPLNSGSKAYRNYVR